MPFTELNVSSLIFNPFEKVSKEWMLISAGTESRFNSMTAAWGGFGSLWNRNVVFTFICPERYTYSFVEENSAFSLCFFDEKYREQLYIMGNASGRDIDKVAECAFSPLFSNDCVYYEQASLVLLCRKIYFNDMEHNNMDPKPRLIYSGGMKVHRMYIGEVEKVLVPEDGLRKV